MSFLNEKEIMDLLETMDPNQIIESKADRLDQTGRELLEEIRNDIQAGEALLDTFGRQFREADEASPTPLSTEGKKTVPGIWFAKSIRIPQWALAAAAVLAGVAILHTLQDWNHLGQTRGRTVDIQEIEPINLELVEVLIKRGSFLLEVGVQNQEKTQTYFKEARDDLMQAYELDPNNIELLSLLARVHEKLGQDKQANRFFTEWQAARDQEALQ